ncbi:MAG: hypothetical protein ACR2NN_29440 [Bryobacteraceae bacterium]
MPARLLAYGGTSFSERRKIGQWPAVPEATLRDSYGLTANTWCFGAGTLGKQPFVILRQRQNIENRGGYPFSLLFDPGDEVWQRFGWSAAAVAAAILNADEPARDLLLQTPERCSAEALERVAAELVPRRGPANGAGENLRLLSLASCVSAEPVVASASALGLHERLDPDRMAGLLEPLPPCFRLTAGWLVGGGAAHGRALGANLVIDEQAIVDQDRVQQHLEIARRYWQAWEFPANRPLAAPFEPRPIWTWDVEPARYLDGLVLLQDVLTAIDPGEGLFERVEQKQGSTAALDSQIEQAATALLTRGSGPLGPKASQWMLALSLREKRKVDAKTAGRFDRKVVFDELRRFGIPPKAVPRQLQIARDVRVGLWLDYLDRLRGDVRKNLESALDQLGPDLTQEEREQLAHAALLALPASDEKLLDWERFRKDPDLWTMLQPVLRDEALVRFQRHDRSAAEAYLAMGEDPGGAEAKALLPQREDFARLVDEVRGMRKHRPELVDAWLAPFPKPAEPPPIIVVPEKVPRRRERTEEPDTRSAELRSALQSVLFRSRTDSVERKTADLRANFDGVASPDLDGMIEENCRESGNRFASAFAGKYLALGDVMSFLPEASQERLIECLAEQLAGKFPSRATLDITHAINNPSSRNAYSQALSRYLLQHPELRKTVAMRRSEETKDLDRRLKSMLAKRKARA